MKKSFIYIILFSFLFGISCALNNGETTYDLGDNYYYLADANESQILLNLKPNQRSKVGKTIIPEEVIEYNFNDSLLLQKVSITKTKLSFIGLLINIRKIVSRLSAKMLFLKN